MHLFTKPSRPFKGLSTVPHRASSSGKHGLSPQKRENISASNAVGAGLISGWGTEIPHATGQGKKQVKWFPSTQKERKQNMLQRFLDFPESILKTLEEGEHGIKCHMLVKSLGPGENPRLTADFP